MDKSEIQTLERLKNYQEHRKNFLRWRNHPQEWIQFMWEGARVWEKLDEICNALVHHNRIVVASGHGVGKTWLLARLSLWWLHCFIPSKVITTAPTWGQVENVLWSEIRSSYKTTLFPLGGKPLNTEINLAPDWYAIGLSTREEKGQREFGSTKMQGYHSPNLLVLLDEAAGVPHETWVASESLITGENNKILAIGNPASPTGDFYEKFKSPLWHKIHISCFDHPNVKAGRTIIAGAVTKKWIEEREQEWGKESPLYIAKAKGEFPAEGDDTLIPLSWAERACNSQGSDGDGKKCLGVDVARFGEDETVIYERIGQRYTLKAAFTKRDTMEIAGMIKGLHVVGKYDKITIDDSGLGGGVTDRCKEMGLPVQPVNFGEGAIDKGRFGNLKAELFWMLRESFEKNEIKIDRDEKTISQLSNIRYKYKSSGQLLIESKDEMTKRGLHSPDRADALALCHYAGKGKEIRIRTL